MRVRKMKVRKVKKPSRRSVMLSNRHAKETSRLEKGSFSFAPNTGIHCSPWRRTREELSLS